MKAINNALGGAITLNSSEVDLSGSASDIAQALNGLSNYEGEISLTGAASVANMTTINSAKHSSVDVSYNLSDTSGNISGASETILNGATNITASDDGEGANMFEFDLLTSTTNTNTVTVSGGTDVDVVELSTALTQSGKVSIDLSAADTADDRVLFNTESSGTSWVTYDNSGNRNGGPSTFTFNKITNFEAGDNKDAIGIFYGGTDGDGGNNVTFGAFREVTDLTATNRLRDGMIYEDSFNSDSGLSLTSDNAQSVTDVRQNIDSIITAGGTAGNSQGSDDLDFTYILYAQSSSNASQVSAYIYSATYGLTNKDAGTAMDDTELKIVGVAEVQNVTNGAFTDSFLSEKPAVLDQ